MDWESKILFANINEGQRTRQFLSCSCKPLIVPRDFLQLQLEKMMFPGMRGSDGCARGDLMQVG